jgi:hypothetical protein
MQNLLKSKNEMISILVNARRTLSKLFILGFSAIIMLICNTQSKAQSILDLSVGTSHQDHFFTNVAYRYQVGQRFRIGLEAQYGAVKYRLIDAKPITEGYSSTVSIPLTIRLYEKEKIRLDLYNKIGMRFQGILDPDNNDKRDSLLNSRAFAFEPGLLVSVNLSEKLDLQSGFTVPVLFQTSPSSLFENVYPGLLHLGLSYKSSDKTTLFAKTMAGGATGGDGDTQKFGWAIQAGFRINLSGKLIPSFIEPTF